MAALKKALTLLNAKPLIKYQAASIVSKAQLDLLGPRAPPYPYDEKSYNLFHALFDKTTYRFDENSKVIVVDGPVAAGKTEFAKALAKGLDMQYIPHVNLETFFIDQYGYDMRSLDSRAPDSLKSFDIHNFLANPYDKRAASMQMKLMDVRVNDYAHAVTHLMSTGQGVVFNRSIFSDFVFMEAMVKFGFISKNVRKYYYDVKHTFIHKLMRPHLAIYLDVPVNVVLQRIKERNRPGEKDSPFYRPEVLQFMEEVYKQRYLKHIVKHSEMLAYDWSEKGDPEVVIEDIERLNLDDYPKESPKMADWRFPDEWSWCCKRMELMRPTQILSIARRVVPYDCPEVWPEPQDLRAYYNLLEELPSNKHDVGYNAHLGDTGILFKTKKARYIHFRKNF